jgi:hypothetical protein
MSNILVPLSVPSSDGPGDAIDTSNTGSPKTFIFSGRATGRYVVEGSNDGATSVTVTVPNFAKSTTVSRTPGNASLSISFLDNMTFPLTTGDPGTQPAVRATYDFVGLAPPSLDLPGITTAVVVRNSGTTTIPFLQLAFELAL